MLPLTEQFNQQQHAFFREPYPSIASRQQRLQTLALALKQHTTALCEAVSADFGQRSIAETRLLEIAPTLQGLHYQLAHLKRWMRPEKRHVHYTFAPASNYVMAQPLGVVGIIVPWNYPIFLALSPLMAALAAGNQVMLKLSEFTPATNQVLRTLCQQALGDCVSIIEGDAQVAAEFAALPFDHLLFTGSTAVGYKVMQAAAKNLTPVTLELGGKSPVLIAPDANIATMTERLLFGKTANAGQTCVAPDYVLVPRALQDALVSQLKADFARFYPNFPDTPDYSAIINTRQYQRLQALLRQAQAAGAEVIPCYTATTGMNNTDNVKGSEDVNEAKRIIPLTLILNAPDDSPILKEEIFGPLLPIIPYDDIADAIDYIRQRPKPLAIYVISDNQPLIERVLTQVQAGGVCINDTLLHVAQDDLPFGGIGPSGLGNYHGPEGFKRFSHIKAVHKKGRFSSSRFIYPPFDRPLFRALLNWLSR
ncbi:coniferyl aldehyde dehydrogenase [Alishewanella tabrizica]|uniref:Aldehyde dehydrogenase n=1 Tax=Alishewanella tabrizica TaxID=671278 RepID=A0ABQ2WM63_9ALTE|nr:coniferyl aldehyde dehydrogenase [Alishewanella tabrizica]GGW62326.1 aldehyde dehydrogenase [Alishewanella tabrizica]